MSSFWNLPIISYMPFANLLIDHKIYKTLARLSLKNTNSIAKAVVKFVKHYHWSKVLFFNNFYFIDIKFYFLLDYNCDKHRSISI